MESCTRANQTSSQRPMREWIDMKTITKHKIKLIAYIIMLGNCSAWFASNWKVFLNNPCMAMISFIAMVLFAERKAFSGIWDCDFEILKERAKTEDMKNESDTNKRQWLNATKSKSIY